jgi:ligand-binding sensor domain-containing protein
VAAIVAVGVGAYYVGARQGAAPQDAPAAAMPAAHPPVNAPNPDSHFTHFRVGESNVKSILADGDIIWVGTSGGVIRYDTASDNYKLYDNRTGLLANGIFHLSKLDGRLVAGTYGGGMSILDEQTETWKTYNIPDGLGDGFIYDVLKLENGDVWIATWSGVNRVRGGNLDDRTAWDLYTVANTNGGLPNDWVYALQPGKDGTVWLATEGGLSHFADGKWQSWGHADGLGAKYETVKAQIEFTNDPANYSEHHARQKEEMGLQDVDVAFNPNYIVALLVDRHGAVWAGTWGGGLSHFDGENWTVYTVDDGLPGNHVFMLHEDAEGTLWIGTNKGLARRDESGFKTFTTSDGLYSNRVFAMTTSDDGSRWIGSFGGVARITSLGE